ncbi:MAG: hypothetical protein COA78_13750 [Blastopirellula sp.]|nr:MAG: hypothetical protein COA78_13750 [Blastopirellula sp.]
MLPIERQGSLSAQLALSAGAVKILRKQFVVLLCAMASALCYSNSPLYAQFPSFSGLSSGSAEASEPSETKLAEVVKLPLKLRLRVAWGGGKMRSWKGQISLTSGTLKLNQLLGMEADEARAIQPFENKIYVQHLTPRVYDGLDLDIVAPADAHLIIQLQDADDQTSGEELSIPIAELLSDNFNTALDDQGNLLLVRRAPGDIIRPIFARDHLVFEPGEIFKLNFDVYRGRLVAGTSVQFQVRLVKSRTDQKKWEKTINATIGQNGDLIINEPFDIPLPSEQGVYDVVASLSEVRLTNYVFAPKPVHQRNIQLVVLDPQQTYVSDEKPPELVVEFDPANPSWWSTISRISQYNPLQKGKPTELHNKKSVPWKHASQQWTQLDTEGWHAYPLVVEDIGQPHILEIEYPSDVSQTLGISVVQPNAAGAIAPIGLDSGLVVSADNLNGDSVVKTHRIVFWPKSETPFVLLTNRDKSGKAVYGKIRVFAGSPNHKVAEPKFNRRTVAYFDKPLFPANFSASEDLNRVSNRSLEDWITFYDGGQRMVKHLRQSGYNSASISVLSDGGTIYPSRLVPSTPKYDKGTFFVDGRDPVKKDVLEMLFRQFDQAGLVLIPAVEFSTPLTKLEQLRLFQQSGESVDLVNDKQQHLLESIGHANGKAAYYNPLRPEVQDAIHEVILELVSRYGHHKSFGGVTLQLDSNGYGQMPGPKWGMDRRSLSEYLIATGQDGQRVFEELTRLDLVTKNILNTQQSQWLDWRAQRLSELHRRIAATLQTTGDKARLYLNTVHSFQGPYWQSQMVPTLPQTVTLDAALLKIGLNQSAYENDPRISLLRTNYQRPQSDTENYYAYESLNADRASDRTVRGHQRRGAMHFFVPDTLRLAEFDQASTIGSKENFTWLATHYASGGSEARKSLVQSLVDMDATEIFQGGWMLPLGHEDATRDLLFTLQNLPAGNFKDLQFPGIQPAVVRQLNDQKNSHLYFVNPTPWPLTIKLTLSSPTTVTLLPLGGSKVPASQAPAGKSRWTITLSPYDLVAVTASSNQLKIVEGQSQLEFTREELIALKKELEELRNRLHSLNYLEPNPDLPNAGFEELDDNQLIPGWTFGKQPETQVALSQTDVFQGKQALQLRTNNHPVWIRSELFDVPASGRLKVKIRYKNKTPNILPKLYIVLDGTADGENKYRTSKLDLITSPASGESWQTLEYAFLNLPLGMKQAKIGVDLMERGDVLIDSVELYTDFFLLPAERKGMDKMLSLAFDRYSKAAVGDCHQILDSYWPRYVKNHVELDPQWAQQQEKPAIRSAELPVREPLKPAPTPSRLDRFKEWISIF